MAMESVSHMRYVAASIGHHPFQHRQEQASARRDQRRHGREIPGSRHFHGAGSLGAAQLSRENPYLLCIVLSDLELVHLGIDPIASSVRQYFEEVVERIRLLSFPCVPRSPFERNRRDMGQWNPSPALPISCPFECLQVQFVWLAESWEVVPLEALIPRCQDRQTRSAFRT